MISLIKYWIAKIWFKKVAAQFYRDPKAYSNKQFQQKWIHLQGQILSKGRIKWRWDKLITRKRVENGQ